MSKSIYKEAKRDLISLTSKLVIPLYDSTPFYDILDEDEERYLNNVKQALEQAQNQEQEHIEHSKKVQEQFSNDTKRIGELESKLIKQDKLLGQIKEIIDKPVDSHIASVLITTKRYYEIENLLKEKENE